MENSKIPKSRIKEIILSGGSSKIPKLPQIIQNFFDEKLICKRLNPDESVVRGAAIYAARNLAIPD